MENVTQLHKLTHAAIDDLQRAFLKCHDRTTEALILSARIKVKLMHDALFDGQESGSELDPEDLCCAV